MKLRLFNKFLLALCLLAIFQSCTSKNTVDSGKINVVCTTNIVADILENIAGSEFEVVCLMGPGVDPHVYKPKPSDIQDLQNADIIVKNGLHLEGKMAEVLEGVSKRKKVITVTESLLDTALIFADDFQAGVDPHVWFDPCLWLQCVEYVATSLQTEFPEQSESINQKFQDYRSNFLSSMAAIDSVIFSIPKEKRVLVTAHDAFSYFAKRYEFDLITIQGLSTQTDFSVKTIEEISNTMLEKQVKCAFFESSIPKKSINTLLRVCKQKGLEVSAGGTLYSDALGTRGGEAGDYLSMFKHNAKEIASCLNAE